MPLVIEHTHPGHPALIALEIMQRYPNLAAAQGVIPVDGVFAPALKNLAIPGESQQVRDALELLAAANASNAQTVFDLACDYWAQIAGEASSEGNATAQRYREQVLAGFAQWPKAPQDEAAPVA